MEENPPVMPNKYAFSVYCEDTSPVKLVETRNVPVKTAPSVPFSVYCEDTILQEKVCKAKAMSAPRVPMMAKTKPLISSKAERDHAPISPSPLIVPLNLPSTPLESEDKENMPVKILRTPTGYTPPVYVDVYVDSDKEDEVLLR